MHVRVISALVLATALSAACSTQQPAKPSMQPADGQPTPSTSGAVPPAQSGSSAQVTAGRLEDFATNTKGMTGRLDYREDAGSAGTAHLTGTFGFDQDSTQPSSGQLQLQAMVQTPFPLSIRAVDKTMYFRANSGPWSHVTGFEADSAQASDGLLAATLLGVINPTNWSALAKAAGSELSECGSTGSLALRGQADVSNAVATMGTYSANLPVRLPQRWPNPVSFTITCTNTGQLTKASEVLTGSTGSATITITVTGYTSPPVAAP